MFSPVQVGNTLCMKQKMEMEGHCLNTDLGQQPIQSPTTDVVLGPVHPLQGPHHVHHHVLNDSGLVASVAEDAFLKHLSAGDGGQTNAFL